MSLGFDAKRVVDRILSKRDYIVEEVRKLLRMPSISGTGEGIEDVAGYLRDWIRDRLGANTTLLRYGGHPIVYGKLDSRKEKTIIFYNMYDVQPTGPLELWSSPPFEARIVEDKIIARGATNTKGALMSTLLGFEAMVEVLGESPVNIIFALEGEEELGSPSMPKFVEDKKVELQEADTGLFTIPSEVEVGKPRIQLGNKGIVFIELKCSTSEYEVHGSYSRGFYNPAVILSKIVSELIDPHFGPKIPWLEEKTVLPTPEDLLLLDQLIECTPLEKMMESHGIKYSRLKGREWYQAVFFKPNVNVDGFAAGYTGPGTKTVLPNEATLRIDFRIVPNIEPEDVIEGFKVLIERLGFSDMVEVNVLDGYTWSKISPNAPVVEVAKEAYSDMGVKPYIIPLITGSAPMHLFTRVLKIPVIVTGPGHGERAHAPNEFITVDTTWKTASYVVHLTNRLVSCEKNLRLL
ncbi:MAG: M20/M25/M40 family metallo-hydrolase [Nitrososphaeria archaeon]|nr:M20/M25/M40 family metallo-hydrolase [Nitrososphaeria archaeon]